MGITEEQVAWIDEADQVLEVLPRSEIRARNLLHRVSATLVFHPDGRLFVQQRVATKDVYPSHFDLMVGGTVEAEEDFSANACREISEELGVRGVPIYPLLQHRFQDDQTNNLIHLFACFFDGEPVLQPEEVADGFWATPAEVQEVLTNRPVCPDSTQGWVLFQQQNGTPQDLQARIKAGLPSIDCSQWVG